MVQNTKPYAEPAPTEHAVLSFLLTVAGAGFRPPPYNQLSGYSSSEISFGPGATAHGPAGSRAAGLRASGLT